MSCQANAVVPDADEPSCREVLDGVLVSLRGAIRLAYVEVLDNEQATAAVDFLRRAVAHFGDRGIRVEWLLTDNGPAYVSIMHALACKTLRIKHLRTPLPATHERQGRTLHPHAALGLGPRGDLRQL